MLEISARDRLSSARERSWLREFLADCRNHDFCFLASSDDSKKLADLTSTDIVDIQKKADAGDASAQFALAEAYDFGNGEAQSDKNAFLWYRKSADQGFAPAQNSLGLMYRTGKGVEQNKEQAVAWYRKATKQGNAKAMFNLGTAYFNGDGVGIDDNLCVLVVYARPRA